MPSKKVSTTWAKHPYGRIVCPNGNILELLQIGADFRKAPLLGAFASLGPIHLSRENALDLIVLLQGWLCDVDSDHEEERPGV